MRGLVQVGDKGIQIGIRHCLGGEAGHLQQRPGSARRVDRARWRATLSRSDTPLRSSEIRDRDPYRPPRLRSTYGRAGSWRRTPVRPSGPARPAARPDLWPVAASDAPGFGRLPGPPVDRAIARSPRQTAPGFARPNKRGPAPALCRAGLAKAGLAARRRSKGPRRPSPPSSPATAGSAPRSRPRHALPACRIDYPAAARTAERAKARPGSWRHARRRRHPRWSPPPRQRAPAVRTQ